MMKIFSISVIFLLTLIVILFTTSCSDNSLTTPQNQIVSHSGKIVCISSPEGAAIILNGVNTGKITPDTLIELKPDDYGVSLDLEGYLRWNGNVKIDSNETEIVNETLEEDIYYGWTAYDLTDLNIPDRHVFCITVDQNNIKWMGIGSSGLVGFYDPFWIHFLVFSGQHIQSIDFDEFHNIWMGSFSGLIKFASQATYYNPQNSNIPGWKVWINKVDVNNNNWLYIHDGTSYPQYLSYFDGNDFINYDTSNAPQNLLSKEIRDICCLQDGTILIGSAENGIYKFDGLNWDEDDTVNDIRAIYNDNGIVWIVDKEGQIFKGEFGAWEYVTTKMGESNRTIAVDGSNVWVGGYASGVSEYDGEKWTDYRSIVQALLNTENVEQIVLDSDGNKWIATTKGLLKRR